MKEYCFDCGIYYSGNYCPRCRAAEAAQEQLELLERIADSNQASSQQYEGVEERLGTVESLVSDLSSRLNKPGDHVCPKCRHQTLAFDAEICPWCKSSVDPSFWIPIHEAIREKAQRQEKARAEAQRQEKARAAREQERVAQALEAKKTQEQKESAGCLVVLILVVIGCVTGSLIFWGELRDLFDFGSSRMAPRITESYPEEVEAPKSEFVPKQKVVPALWTNAIPLNFRSGQPGILGLSPAYELLLDDVVVSSPLKYADREKPVRGRFSQPSPSGRYQFVNLCDLDWCDDARLIDRKRHVLVPVAFTKSGATVVFWSPDERYVLAYWRDGGSGFVCLDLLTLEITQMAEKLVTPPDDSLASRYSWEVLYDPESADWQDSASVVFCGDVLPLDTNGTRIKVKFLVPSLEAALLTPEPPNLERHINGVKVGPLIPEVR